MVFEQNVLIWAVAGGIAYVVYRRLFAQRKPAVSQYEHEIEDILKSDKYRVKGRFEE